MWRPHLTGAFIHCYVDNASSTFIAFLHNGILNHHMPWFMDLPEKKEKNKQG